MHDLKGISGVVGGFGLAQQTIEWAAFGYHSFAVKAGAYVSLFRSRTADTLRIMMPNRAFASCGAFVAGMALSGIVQADVALFGSLMILSTYSSQAVFNNIRDLDGDSVNAPSRPLVSGALSIGFAWTLMGVLIALGFLFAYLASPFLVAVNAAYIILGIAYSAVTKARWHLAALTLATTHIVTPIVSGYLVFGQPDLRIAVVALLMYATNSLVWSIKDYKDVEGDRKTGVLTLPVVLTSQTAALVTFAALALPLAGGWVAWYVLGLSTVFLAIYLASGVIRLFLGKMLLADQSPQTASKILINFRFALLLEMVGWCLS
ncbi:MAG: UbiA family prenyltransferase [Candidatus Micrarchaeota archaeon]